jgi:hypothetical protein
MKRVVPVLLVAGVVAWLAAGHLVVGGQGAATPAMMAVSSAHAASLPGAGASKRGGRVELACDLAVGDQAAFSVETEVTDPGSGAPEEADRFRGVLSWRVLKSPVTNQWYVAAAFSGTEVRQGLMAQAHRVSEPLDTVFLIRMDRDCRFLVIGFPLGTKVTTRRFLVSVMRSLEMVVSSTTSGAAWEYEQSDGTGRFRAQYHAQPAGGGAFRVTRNKSANREANGPEGTGLKPELVSGLAQGTFDVQGKWFRAVEGTERMRLRTGGHAWTELVLRFSIARDDQRFRLTLPPGVDPKGFDFDDPYTM